MPRRDDLQKILLIGSGPIVIGQACEFDYSGTQACKALREEGYEVVLVNSNPATIMTDPGTADRTYIEPLTWEIVAKVIEAERPDALLPTLGGQTGLNLAMDLARARRAGEVRRRDDRRQRRRDRQGREPRAVQAGDGEDRPRSLPRARRCTTSRRPATWLDEIGLPAVVRPSFTMGGSGSAIAYNRDEFDELVRRGLELSPVHRGADRGIDHRLERVRDGGDARRGRQRRDHLLDRKLRPDGRPHGRLDHRGAGADADRQRIPADARRLAGGDSRDRRRDGRLEHSVRDPSAARAG